MDKTKTITVSLGTTPIFLVFLVLKLTNVIDWSWWWVTCPLWLPWAFMAAIFAIPMLMILVAGVVLLVAGVGVWLSELRR